MEGLDEFYVVLIIYLDFNYFVLLILKVYFDLQF